MEVIVDQVVTTVERGGKTYSKALGSNRLTTAEITKAFDPNKVTTNILLQTKKPDNFHHQASVLILNTS